VWPEARASLAFPYLNTTLYTTLAMILYENVKPIEHLLRHLICALSHLMCACKQCNLKLSLFIQNIEVADEFITSKTQISSDFS